MPRSKSVPVILMPAGPLKGLQQMVFIYSKIYPSWSLPPLVQKGMTRAEQLALVEARVQRLPNEPFEDELTLTTIHWAPARANRYDPIWRGTDGRLWRMFPETLYEVIRRGLLRFPMWTLWEVENIGAGYGIRPAALKDEE